MKIILDTKEESVQDLRDTMRMLQALIESRGGKYVGTATEDKPRDIFSDTSSPSVGGLMGMFGDSAPLGTGSILSSIDQPKEDSEKIPEVQIIEY